MQSSDEKINYGYDELLSLPVKMEPWNMRLDYPALHQWSKGQYVLVGCEQAGEELHHEVEVIDENGSPLGGVWVIFGYPGGGPDLNLKPDVMLWPNGPAVLKGNAQKTTISGCVKHTFQQGGEDIWIWDLQPADPEMRQLSVINLPSVIVRNCTWQRTPAGHFEHTGVKLTFQRRMNGVIPTQQMIDEMRAGMDMVVQELLSLSAEFKRLKDRVSFLQQTSGGQTSRLP